MIYRTQGKHSNHHTTDAVFAIMKLTCNDAVEILKYTKKIGYCAFYG
jgi:hypothetical protein